MPAVWLGIDIGTSGCRICAIDDDRQIVHQARTSFPANQPYPSPYEQWQIVTGLLRQSIAALTAFNIAAIAVDGTSGSVMLCDVDGQPLTKMLLYNNTHATVQSQQISDITPPHSGAHGASSGLAKLLYFQQHVALPANYYLVHQADWIASQIGAEIGITDYNNALKSGFDPERMQWPDWLENVTSRHVLPKVVAPGTVIGKMSAALMQDLHLKQSTAPNIVAGTTDSLAAFIATGASNSGDGVTSLGSTLVLKLICDKAAFAAEYGIYSHKLGNRWLVGGASNTGGAVIRQFFSDQQIAVLAEQIDVNQMPPDYYPLSKPGERFPIANPDMPPRLMPRPDNDSLFLHGLFAGIATIEQQGYAKLQQLCGRSLQSLRTVGGGSENSIWQQLRQQKLAVPFVSASNADAAFGSALLAKNGLQRFDEVTNG